MEPVVLFRVPCAVFVPASLCAGALALAVGGSLWWLLALPFVVLGSFCAAPNLNLADGFLALVAVVVGIVVSCFHAEAGIIIIVGTSASWVLSSIEKLVRAVPDHEKP
ncbi:MAG: hypothetical protein LBB55_04830 [Zoogloeaceae bacterium]|nr:hypothetical protein [Zoogloeaceae bacterium]